MKAMKYILVGVFLMLCSFAVKAQQAPSFTQYMFNDYLINPAVAGAFNYFQVRANSRIQWMGISDAPRTMSIMGYGPFKERDMGYGGYIWNDVTGPESKLALGGSYAYNIAVNDVMRISGGLSLGILQYKLDGTSFYTGTESVDEDPAMPNAVESKTNIDATLGFYLYSSQFYVGISAHQLLGNKYGFADADTLTGISRLTQHVYLSGGFFFMLNRDLALQPTAMIKYTSPGQIQAEIDGVVYYKRMVWGGLAYRMGASGYFSSDAISILVGYNYENKLNIGLSYDITLSDLRRYSNGTIEVMIAYRFNSIK